MEHIRLNNSLFEGKNSIYLFDDDSTLLVDTGLATEKCRQSLEAGLAEHDVAFEEVDQALLTHFHADHAGLAGALHEEAGASIHVHKEDADLAAADPDAWDSYTDLLKTHLEEWSMPSEEHDPLLKLVRSDPSEVYSGTVPVETFEDGDRFNTGETTLEVIHLPGHTKGVSGFILSDRDEVLSSDALLPIYTPNIGGADVRIERALEKFLSSLDHLTDRVFERARPGHRDAIGNPAARAHEIKIHHRERAFRVVSILKEQGSADPWTVSAHLFGDLKNIHVLHGPGEASAHLKHLENTGDVERYGAEYTLTEDARERLAAHDGDTWPLQTD